MNQDISYSSAEARSPRLTTGECKTNGEYEVFVIWFHEWELREEKRRAMKRDEEKWSSYKEHKGNALAPRADEGRD